MLVIAGKLRHRARLALPEVCRISSQFSRLRRFASGLIATSLLLSGCTLETMVADPATVMRKTQALEAPPPNTAGPLNSQIGRYAAQYRVPESLIRRIIVRESGYNPHARNGPYWGLMQIRYDTAQSMGYHGGAQGLLDADTNLRYGVKYLAGAYMVAHGDPEKAVSFYATGYYYDARRLGLLDEVGLKRAK